MTAENSRIEDEIATDINFASVKSEEMFVNAAVKTLKCRRLCSAF